ncbi:MAG TPA: SGNH/GDSL hydrolase family protein [Planctomycetota bacterium]|nr:SGNH/GDSL hydrolase family protein [Planctomycetota bacterium]
METGGMTWGKLTRGLLISLASLAVLLVLAELLARASEPGAMSLYDRNPYRRDAQLDHTHIPGFRGRWEGTWYEINSRGWRGPELEPTFDPNEFRVVALGDSCTLGKGVRESETWPRQLERLLQQELGPGHSVKVANLGVNGYSTRDYLHVFQRDGPPLRPHLVVIGYNVNDFPNVLQRVDQTVYQNRHNLRARIPSRLRDSLGRLALFRFARATYYELNRRRDWANVERVASQAGETTPRLATAFEKERQLLQELRDAAASSGARVAIFLFPYESMVYLDAFQLGPIERLRETADELGISFVSLSDRYRARAREVDPPRRLFLRGDRYHPNPEGYRIVAESVLEEVRSRGWLPPED